MCPLLLCETGAEVRKQVSRELKVSFDTIGMGRIKAARRLAAAECSSSKTYCFLVKRLASPYTPARVENTWISRLKRFA